MSKYKTVCYCGLFNFNNDPLHINAEGLYYPWYSDRGFVSLSINLITHEDKLIEDLLKLIDQNIEGSLDVRSDDWLYTKLVVTPAGIDAFRGETTYPDEAYKTFRKQEYREKEKRNNRGGEKERDET